MWHYLTQKKVFQLQKLTVLVPCTDYVLASSALMTQGYRHFYSSHVMGD